ncbi:2,3-diaminopropionate biosynthesis protein SbnA [Kitasatospora nipponensis]|uniref:N-(2-amino-2-carboxyethyl)-L-glutamate synthase n=1 Tax=Kitasatospora nipponensis TaxID=258049 RepID=A0ABN1W025_9ACTN
MTAPATGLGAGTGVLSAIGSTPLVELTRIFPDSAFRTFAKLESHNPGGSVKDRSALGMLLERIQCGELIPGKSVVVESSSGNLGIGLAQVCRYFDLRFICVVDPRTNQQNIAVMRALGAEVDLVTETDPVTGEYLPVRIRRVRELVARTPMAYCPDQYGNPLNARAHRQTMREIVEQLEGRLDYLLCATSSCGTLRGCSEYARELGLPVRIIAVDAIGSAIFDGPPGPRLIPGHGASVRPALFAPDLADEVIHVGDLDCLIGCRLLARREAILAGGSSGAVLSALDSIRRRVPAGSVCAVILPDRGERYLDTIYSDSWAAEHFGEVGRLWEEPTVEASPC